MLMTGFESNKFVVKGIAAFCRIPLTTGSRLLHYVLMNLVAPFLSISPVIASCVSVALCSDLAACCEC